MIQINPLKSYIDGGVRAALTTPPSASLVFDLPGKAIWVKGVKLKGTDHTYIFNHDNYITLTNTPDKNNPESEDIKIGVNITTLKNAIDTTYNGGTLALLQEGLNTEERTWLAKILHNYINNVLPITKNLKINGTNYAIYTTADSLPLFFVPTSLGTTGQILACTSSGLIWVDLIQNTDYRVSLSSATSNSDYRIILKQGANNNPETDFVRFSEYLTFNPYTKTLKINNIKVVTATDIYTGSNAGLVPTATSAQLNYYLRGDGTWVNIATEMAAANTWRPIKVGNTDALGSGTNTGTLSFTAGTGIALSWDATNKRIIITNSSPDINHNTDENVRQVPKTDNVNRPLMMINGSTSAGEQINTSMFSTGIYANASTKMITANGFIKAGSSDDYILLGGGNHKALSDFSMSGHTHAYLPLSGGTMTGTIRMGVYDLNFQGSDPGDLVWFDENGNETERIWSSNGNGSLYYRTKAGTTCILYHSGNLTSLPANGGNADTINNLHASDFVRAFSTSNDNIDSDWGQSFKTFDPIPSGTPPELNPNISLLSIGNNFSRRKLLAFMYNNDNIYYRRRIGNEFSNWKKLAFTSDIPTVTDYYWANVKVSSTSSTSTSPTFSTCYTNNWFRSIGLTGWYNESYAGGIYMEDTTWVRIYNNKKFYVNNSEYDAIHSAGGVYVAGMVHAYANYLKSTCNGAYVQIGPQNSSHAHYVTDAAVSHWFNKRVDVNGAIWRYGTNYGINSDGYFYAKGIYANRDGLSTGGGISLYANIDPMTYGIAFRETSTYGKHGGITNDWATYFTMNDDISRGWIFRRGSANVVSIAGSGLITTNGDIHITHATNATMTNATTNPKLIFSENGGLKVGLVYTDYDSYRVSKGLKVMDVDGSDTENVWLETLGYMYSSGFCKNGSSDSYVLLGGGGHKALSDFSMTHSHPYLPLSGGTMTGMLKVNAPIFGYVYAASNNRAAFMWDKPGSYCTGVGANGSENTILFSACDGSGNWVDYKQYWIFKGDVTASNFYSSSDIRFKDNINNISKSIRSFNWKESGLKSYGLIALEIENEYPELVSSNDNGYKSINYTSALCMLIAKLENEVDELKEKVKLLEDKLRKYENTL